MVVDYAARVKGRTTGGVREEVGCREYNVQPKQEIELFGCMNQIN